MAEAETSLLSGKIVAYRTPNDRLLLSIPMVRDSQEVIEFLTTRSKYLGTLDESNEKAVGNLFVWDTTCEWWEIAENVEMLSEVVDFILWTKDSEANHVDVLYACPIEELLL